MKKLLLVIFFTMFPVLAHGGTYYISPTGSNSNSGTSSGAPWLTFDFAIPKLRPGDVLLLEDGTYNPKVTGWANINCSTGGAANGTAAAPITVKAQHERQAFLQGDGSVPTLTIVGCGWWRVEGLHIEGQDNTASPTADLVYGTSSHDIVFRRNLLAKTNRCGNNIALDFAYNNQNILIEENEVYSFPRSGIQCFENTTSGCTVRRNYINSRNYDENVPPQPPGCPSQGGGAAITMYFAHDSLVENNIAEGTSGYARYSNRGSNNRFLGNVALNGHPGFMTGRHPGYGDNISGNVYRNNVAIGQLFGFYANSDGGVTFDGNTAFNSSLYEFVGNNDLDRRNNPRCASAGECWDVVPNLTATNDLVVNAPTAGFYVAYPDQFASRILDYLNVFNSPDPYTSGTETRTHATTIDPGMGSCMLWIPLNSPMKGAGKNGADIGANILYRYQDGVLTNQPLWDATTGKFPCGAIVAGVNDIAGSSCYDVNQRLNVNANGCTLPTTNVAIPAPSNLKLVGF